MCRAWCRLATHPSLLREVHARFDGERWAERFLQFATWLPPRAAHIRQLSATAMATIDGLPATPSDADWASAAEATVGLLAACAGAGQLEALGLQLGFELGASASQWLPALRSLRRLKISSLRDAAFDAPLASLAALEQLELGGWPMQLADGARLPASLTALSLEYVASELMPEQASLAELSWPARCCCAMPQRRRGQLGPSCATGQSLAISS